ncbi:MAG: hypothetical protein QG657_3714 [Acidobacteriota bacterium]|nr:hypothetical protein [Acidobacteriota bacterium]
MLIQTFIGNQGRELCIVYHWICPNAPAVIICPGIANSMSDPRYLLSILARKLASLGLNVFQFDYFGSGDSVGDFIGITQESLIESAKQIIEFAESLGVAEFGLIGYGIGNAIIGSFIEHPKVKTAALLSPHFHIYSPEGQEIWKSFAQNLSFDMTEPVFSRRQHASAPIGDLWRAVVGETTEGSNACGPLNPFFLQGVTDMRPQEKFLISDKPLLIISEQKDDALFRSGLPVEYAPIESNINPGRISWHWCIQCREIIVVRLSDWFQSHLITNHNLQRQSSLNAPGIAGVDQPGEKKQLYSLTIDVEGQSVLGILHVPSLTSKPKPVCVIYEPGLTCNRVDIHRVGPRLAAALTKRGFYMCQYDARGTGVSAGEFHEFTWSRKMQDILRIMQYIEDKTAVKHFVILSASAGAKIACLAANRDPRVCGMILWGPIIEEYDPEELFPEYNEKNKWIMACGHAIKSGFVRHPSGTLVFESSGLWLGVNYHIDEHKYKFFEEFESCRKPGLIVLPSSDKAVVNSVLQIILKHDEKHLHEIPGIHGFEPEVVEDVVNYSAEWLEKFIASSSLEPYPGG